MNAWPNPPRTEDEPLLAEFRDLWADAEALWERHENSPAFHSYVSADYAPVCDALLSLRGRVVTVLEWGSGLGVVSIMANRMGFDAFGIEAEPAMVELAEDLAESYGSNPRFAVGSFVPDEFDWHPGDDAEINRTIIDTPSAYADLDMELRDFDLIYAYPWPDEHGLYQKIIRECGRRNSLLLTYDAREGIGLKRVR